VHSRPPISSPASTPSPSRSTIPIPAIAQPALPRSFESHVGSLGVKLPVRDNSDQSAPIATHALAVGIQAPLLSREAFQTTSKDAGLPKAPSPRQVQPAQEVAILPLGEGEKSASGNGS
jgi:hypothetical protein